MATAIISKDNLKSYAYNNMYSIVNDRTKINDPKDADNLEIRKFVFNADPSVLGLKYSFPYIVLEFPVLKFTNPSADGKHKDVGYTQKMVVRVAKDGSSNSTTNIGKDDMLDICDDLYKTFNSVTARQTLSDLNMSFVKLDDVNSDYGRVDEYTEYETEFEVMYEIRLKTSE